MKVLTLWLTAIAVVPGFAYDVREIRCGICKALIDEMREIVKEVPYGKKTLIGSHRLDHKGNLVGKEIPLVKSESFLTDALEQSCRKMENYAKGIDKKTGRVRVVKLFSDVSAMNPEMDEIQPISDSDLNHSMFMHCNDIIDEYEEQLLSAFRSPRQDLSAFCSQNLDMCVSHSNEEL